MERVGGLLEQTLNHDGAARKQAERELQEFEKKPGFCLALLQLLEGAQQVHMQQVTAVYFKNMVRKFWAEDKTILTENDRQQIKSHILNLMCKVDARTRPTLSEAVRIIGENDFPFEWANLLPDLTRLLASSQDFSVIIGLLETANTLFKFFRIAEDNDDNRRKLKYSLDNFAEPLLRFYQRCCAMVREASANLPQVFAALRLLSRIFFSLNYLDLPEFFEDHIKEWMAEFDELLKYKNPALDSDDDEVPGPVERVQTAIVENIKLYANKYEEEFRPFINNFTECTWNLLMVTPAQVKYDDLVVVSIKFITQLVGNVRLMGLFQPTLGEIVMKIVVPNLNLRESDVERFEDNPMEYIRSDIEGSDVDSRRRVACDLIRGMCRNFEDDTTKICDQVKTQLLSEYSANPSANWQKMDCAITLVIALAAKRQTQQLGVTEVNTMAGVDQFFTQFVLPCITAEDVNSQPVVKADVIKFFTTFRNQMPRDLVVNVLPHLARLLQAKSFVVHTYAAAAIERIFMIRDQSDPMKMSRAPFIYGTAELNPILEVAVVNLFAIVEQHELGVANEYVAKAIMRVLSKAEPQTIVMAAPTILTKVHTVLQAVCANPVNPRFIHYLFESLAVLIRSSCKTKPELAQDFENSLMPAFQTVLEKEISELTPYVFQILAMLLELRPGGASESYLNLFQPLLHPVLWSNRGNVPALVRLVEAFLHRAAAETIGNDSRKLEGLLGVFKELLRFKSSAELSIRLLIGIVEFLPPDVYSNYLGTILQFIFQRLQSLRSKSFAQAFTFFISVLIGKHGCKPVEDAINGISQGLFFQILDQVIVANISGIKRTTDRKACVVALTRVITESQALQSEAGAQTWANVFVAILNVIAVKAVSDEAESPEEKLEMLEEGGYSSSYSKLVYAQTGVRDSFKEVANPTEFFVTTLAKASAATPGHYQRLIEHALQGKPNYATAFKTYCAEFRANIV